MNKLIRLLLLGSCWSSYAALPAAPVVDVLAIEQIVLMLDMLNEQYKNMEKQLTEAELHTGVLNNQLTAITGKTIFSDVYNSNADKQARVWAPNSIEEFEDMLEYGFNPGDLSDRYAYYQEKFPGIEPQQIDPKNPQSAHRDLYTYNEEWTKLNLVGFAQTFDAVNESYEKINNLLEEANKHTTLKESSDFSNRLLGELGYLLQNLIQVQNFELHLNTMLQQAEQNHIAAHSDFFTFKRR